MNHTIRINGPVVPLDFQYETAVGTVSRFDLVDKYTHTIQGCLIITGPHYSPHKAGELIMRSVISLLSPDGARQSADNILNKLENGLSRIGYYPVGKITVEKPDSIIPKLYIEGRFPADADKWCNDNKTGEEIGFDGVLSYLDLLDQCLAVTEMSLCDRAARYLVQAVKLLAVLNPNESKEEIEDLLWQAMDELGFRLDIVPWYKARLAKNN